MSDEYHLNLLQLYAELRTAIKQSGDQKKFCQQHGLSESILSDTLNARRDPGPALLKALGYEKISMYRRLQ